MQEKAPAGVLAEAQVLLQKATRVCFMGFGYHASNLERLDFKQNTVRCKTRKGTGVGLSAVKRELLAREYKIQVSPPETTSLTFLRDHVLE
jgi:hypothetical protein